MRSLSNSLRAAQRGSQAHSQTPYVRLVFSPPDNFLTGNPARTYTTRQVPNHILAVQHVQGRYGVSLPVTETPNVAAIVILSNHDGSLSNLTWEGWLLRPYFGLVVGATPEYQETESLLVSRAIFHGSEGTSTLELHLVSAWGRLSQTWINRTTSSGPVKWLRGHPSFRRTIGQIVHELCGGGTPENVRIQNTGVEYIELLETYAPLANGNPSIVNWDGSSLYIIDTRQKFNTVNIGIRSGDATTITSIFPTAVLTVTGDLSNRGVITIRLADSVPLQQAIILNHNGTFLEIEYITTSRDLGLYFTSNSQLDYEPTYVSRGQANLTEVLREVLSRTTYRPILRETGLTLVDIGSEAGSVEGDTSRQYLTDHQIFSHEPSRKLLIPNEIIVSSIAQGVIPTLQKPFFEGIAPSPTAPSTHPALISQQSQGKITRYEVESSVSSDAEAQVFADAYIDTLAFDTATARFKANMDVGLEVYDNVLVGHDAAGAALDAGDPWTGLTSLGYVSDILRVWTPGFYRMSVTLGDIQTAYVPLTQSRQNYLIQQGLLTKETQDDDLFELSEVLQPIEPTDTFWGRTQSLSINALVPTGDYPTSGLVGSRWSTIWTDAIFADAVNIGHIIVNPSDSPPYLSPIIRLMPDVAANGLIIDSSNRPSTVRPNNLITDLGSSMMYWDTLYINRIAAVGLNPFMIGFSSIILRSGTNEVSVPGEIALVGSDIHVYSGGSVVDLSNLGSGTPNGMITLVGTNGILVSGYTIILDSDDMPPLFPASSINTLGLAFKPWDALYVDHVWLTPNESAADIDGAIWQDSNGHVIVRTGGVSKNLSVTLTGSHGIIVAGNGVILDSDDMPPLFPASSINTLGLASNPWDALHVDHIYLHAGESGVTTNGAIWQDGSGNIQARTGGETKNLSDIGLDTSIPITGSHGIIASGSHIILDSDDMPPLFPEHSINTLGLSSNPWDALHVDHVYLHPGEAEVTTNGAIWQDSSGDIQARTGGVTKNLSDIGTGDSVTLVNGAGIHISGYTISIDGFDIPTLIPSVAGNDLGSDAKPWDSLYVDHIFLHAGESTNTANGAMWQDSSGNIQARTGGNTRNLSDIGLVSVSGITTLTEGAGITITGSDSSRTIALDSSNLPTLQPSSLGNDLGTNTRPWDRLYVDHIFLTPNENPFTANGIMWQDSSGNILARSGDSEVSLSDIGSGVGTGGISTLLEGIGISVTGSGDSRTITLDFNNLPGLISGSTVNDLGTFVNPWDALYVDHLYLHADESSSTIDGVIWQNSDGDILARSGSVTRNLSNIGTDSGSITLTGSDGILVSGYAISLDNDDMPPLYPANSGNDLGRSSSPWDRLYVDHLVLTPSENATTANGYMWQNSSGHIIARTGNAYRDLSDIGSGVVALAGGTGISIVESFEGHTVSLDGTNLPTLEPANPAHDLGTSAKPWDRLYVDHIFLHAGENSFTANGIIWQDGSGHIRARSGGALRNLSDIGTGSDDITLVGGGGISVLGYAISLDGTDLPTLVPASLANDLGTNAIPWDRLYVDHIFLTAGENAFTANGIMWQDSSGNILARSGDSEVNLSDIGTGTSNGDITLVGGIGITVVGYNIHLDGADIPTLIPSSSANDLGTPTSPWDRLYADHIWLTPNEDASAVNGTMWQDSSGNILARSGGELKSLSDIGTVTSSVTISGDNGILVSGPSPYIIVLDSDDMPPLYPASSINGLGLVSNPWDSLYVDHIYLHAGEGASSTNGAMWQGSDGHIYARTGDVTKSLSDIGTGGGTGGTFDGNNMPTLRPASAGNSLGSGSTPWDSLFVDHIRLTANEPTLNANGAMWQDGSGHIQVRTGNTTKSLSDIGTGTGGTGTLFGGVGITISGNTISIDSSDLPTLQPASSSNNLGHSTIPWDSLFVSHIFLTSFVGVGIIPFPEQTLNGAIWLDGDGNIQARSGDATRNLSDIGTGTGSGSITLINGPGILISGYTISIDSPSMPTLLPFATGNDLGSDAKPWDRLYVDHIFLHAGEGASTANGTIWHGSGGDIFARTGGVTKNLSDIGSGGGNGTTYSSGTGILISGSLIGLDNNNMPTLTPAGGSRALGTTSSPWDRLYVDHLYLHASEASVTTNGVMWQDSSGNIQVRSGSVTRNLSNIGSGSGTFDGDNMPILRPAASGNTLGISSDPWNTLWTDYVVLTVNHSPSSLNGAMWSDPGGNIIVRTGGITKNLSNIPLVTGVSGFTAGDGISITGTANFTLAVSGLDLPTLIPDTDFKDLGSTSAPWSNVFTTYLRLDYALNRPAGPMTQNGAVWIDSTGNIWARSGGINRGFSAIGTGTGTTTLSAGSGINISTTSSGYHISVRGGDMPTLSPNTRGGENLGSSGFPWGLLYIGYIFLRASQPASGFNGAIWQDASTNIMVRSGSLVRNLSDVGPRLDSDRMPTLLPTSSFVDLGSTSSPWDRIYGDQLRLLSDQGANYAPANGTIWRGSDGNVWVRSGSVSRNLSAIGFDANNMPTLRPASSGNDLGISSDPWDSLYVDHIYLHSGEGASTTNGVLWQDSSGHIQARSGGITRSLSDIVSGGSDGATYSAGSGILINTSNVIRLNNRSMPTLIPGDATEDLGNANDSWDRLYVDHIFLHAGEGAATTNGAIWQTSSGHIFVRTGGVTRSLTNIGTGSGGGTTYTGGSGITVSGSVISLDAVNLPGLRPGASGSDLGISSDPWDSLYVDHLYLHAGEGASSINGTIWQGSGGIIYARSGGVTKNLSDIGTGTGGGTTYTGGLGITITGSAISIDGASMPTLRPNSSGNDLGGSSTPWDSLYVDHIYLHAGEGASNTNGVIWQGSGGHIYARSGSVTRNLSNIGTGGSGGGTTYTAGTGILITGTSISLNVNNLPTLRPLEFLSALGIPSDPWNFAYITYIILTSNQSPGVTANGFIWQDTSGNVRVRSGGTIRNLSDIGTGGGLDSSNMPTLTPASSGNDLGLSARPWDSLYVDHIYLHTGEGNSSTSGAMWQNSSGDIIVRSGGAYRNLSEIGSGGGGGTTYTAGAGITISGTTIALNSNALPTLRPDGSSNDLGISSDPWDILYVDHIYLHAGEGASSANGAIWQGSGGNIYARSGGVTKNLSDIGTGGGSNGSITLIAGTGISVSGYTISVDGNGMPTLRPGSVSNDLGTPAYYWDKLFVDHIHLHPSEAAVNANGSIWQDGSGNIMARSGGAIKNLSEIGSGGGGGVTYAAGLGITISGITISVRGDRMPALEPAGLANDLGSPSRPWDALFVDHVRLILGETGSGQNGDIWMAGNGRVYVRTGNQTKDLTNI